MGSERMGSYTDPHKTLARERRNGQLIVAPSVTEGSLAGVPVSYTVNRECQGCYTGQHTHCWAAAIQMNLIRRN
jgi:hypothetical protein